jgi:rod shape determining protein RodA
MLFGLMSLYSVGLVNPGNVFSKQLMFAAIGLVPFGLFFFVSPAFWKRISNWLYILNALMLTCVFFIGKTINGAERWIMLPGHLEFQPSEFAKLLAILTLAAFYAHRQDSIHKLSTFLWGFLHVLVPMFLIFKQPHLGAAMTVFLMWIGVSVVAGVPVKYLATFLLVVGLLGVTVMRTPSLRGLFLHKYQENRIHGKLGPKGTPTAKEAEETRTRLYQTDRAAIAFGVGGATGVGFLHGEQKAGKFIPEQINDFIVTVIGEEGGLLGCSLLLLAYGAFFYRIFLVMLNATEPFYKMVAAGIFVILGFHTFFNMAMVLQLVPVVGLWLPFMSSGGTALWLCMACVGLLLGIRRKERPLLF